MDRAACNRPMQQDQAKHTTGRTGFHRLALRPQLPSRMSRQFPRIGVFAAREVSKPLCVVDEARRRTRRRLEFAQSGEGDLGFLGVETLAPHESSAVVRLELHSLSWEPPLRLVAPLGPPRPARRPVRHRDRLAEMSDRLLERRAAQRLVAGLAPPFDR